MADIKQCLTQTAHTAAFAFREYFRPFVVVVRFFMSKRTPGEPARADAEDQDPPT
jgi:hypothetical protein